MGDENKFVTPEYMLPRLTKTLIKEHGPMTTEELSEQLNESFGVHVSVAAVEFNPPELWIDDILSDSNLFVVDDSERYHLTGNHTSQEA